MDTEQATVPYGYCHCGCGVKTLVSPKTSTHHGFVRGEPRRYIKGHNARKTYVAAEPTQCGCGCGQLTNLAPETDASKGWVRGQPLRFIRGHNTATQRPVSPVDFIVDEATGCWIWQRARDDRAGYGLATDPRGHRAGAHRVIYERYRGAIPKGLHLDHLCRNPPCVNPDHLEPVTPAENTRRQARTRLGFCGAFAARLAWSTTTLSHEAIADMLGVARPTVSDAIRGESWTID